MALTIREYISESGHNPFRDWLNELDGSVRARVQARILRFEIGNLGDYRSIGSGVWEARLLFGAGYRIYFGKDGKSIVILLGGGDKSTQRVDISQAKQSWHEYLEAKSHDEA